MGVTAVPDPFADVSSDTWLVYQPFNAGILLADATGFISSFVQFPFDSRAMRKVEDGQDVVTVVSNASATDGMAYNLVLRFLVKLH